MPVIIDANGAILGRLASNVAKRLLTGEEIVIVNAEMAVISGPPKSKAADWAHKRERGGPHKGPFYPRYPDRLIKKVVSGMLPAKSWAEGSRGRAALARLKVYIGCPDQFAGKAEKIKIKTAVELSCKYMTLQQLCRQLGAKV